MRRIIEMLPCGSYWRLWVLTTVIAFGFFSEAKEVVIGGGVRGGLMLPKTGDPKVSIRGGVLGGLILPQVGAPKARVGSGVRANSEWRGK